MADPLSSPERRDDVQVGPTHRPAGYPGTPRWVKLSGIVALVLALLVVVIMVASGGSHGPGRHLPSGNAGGHGLPVAYGP